MKKRKVEFQTKPAIAENELAHLSTYGNSWNGACHGTFQPKYFNFRIELGNKVVSECGECFQFPTNLLEKKATSTTTAVTIKKIVESFATFARPHPTTKSVNQSVLRIRTVAVQLSYVAYMHIWCV